MIKAIASGMMDCDHTFIVVSKKKSDKSEHATQLMCQHCLMLESFTEVAQVNQKAKDWWNKNVVTGESQTTDDS